MSQIHTAVLLVNLGTPDSPRTPDVRKYLRQFLMDGRVIDVPYWQRFLLVKGIIAPFRAPKSAKEYQKLWTERGSPLLFHSQDAAALLQTALGNEYAVKLGMRYQSPSIESALDELMSHNPKRLVVLPMFPQYASSTTGSANEEVMRLLKKRLLIPQVHFIDSYAEHPAFIEAFAAIGKAHLASKQYDHVLFTYHGLPERHLKKENNACEYGSCCAQLTPSNRLCYRAQCFATTRKLVKMMGLKEGDYTVSFQSRLGKNPWIKPYTDLVIDELAAKGVKRILAFSPSFTADCLETVIEIGETYSEQFIEKGGEHWQLVESLNNHPLWIKTLKDLVLDIAPQAPDASHSHKTLETSVQHTL
ncbi:MAG: ferrochelatase [Cytophagales bacterium]|nr:MAG: ferrochelatase [Cytophagales bacterium]TAF60385.1 MAG: ferrochelatase [Cytophagales bacterium]